MQKVKLLDNKPSEWLAHRFYVLGQFDMCMTVVDQILRRNPDNPEALSLKGNVLRSKGQIDEALNCFQNAFYLDTENVRHSLEIAKCLYFLGRFPQSLKILKDLESTPEGNLWEVFHLIGLCYLKLRKYDDANDAFQNALDTDLRIETFLELINIYEIQKDSSALSSIISEAMKYHSNNAVLRRRIGKLNIARNRLSKALSHLQFALTRDETDSLSYLLAGSIEQENQHFDDALTYYRKAFVGLSNSPALWNNVALCIQLRSRREAVVACCKRAMFFSPFEALPLTNIGLTFLEMGLYCSAAIVLRRARSLDPSVRGAAEGLAVALMNLGDYDESIHLLQNELQKTSDHELSINLAICFYKAGKMKEAKSQFMKFMKMMKEEPALEASYPIKNVLVPMFTNCDALETC
ncbi:TPR Domain containing protein [Tritrichomonas foetus]|uniref:TPR Domain containing protein n=1 Tax=Tritrichomonas foetus TaxID=1144522 RepID=A0A1J4JPW1_9EUKA|nr:TPR Domain containing protein [Tritrichomonas foetus]|eukprot:OHT01145.1 TPR Domain containing protein [Tritrichomonas foetus]